MACAKCYQATAEAKLAIVAFNLETEELNLATATFNRAFASFDISQNLNLAQLNLELINKVLYFNV